MLSFFEDIRYFIIKKYILKRNISSQRKIISNLPPALAHRAFYYIYTKKDLNLKSPKTFNDKIHYMELWVHGNQESQLADKYLVREYLAEKGYKDLAPKIYGAYDSVAEINFKSLPKSFVLKCNHGCGDIIFCEDKTRLNFEKAKQQLSRTLSEDFSTQSLEPHYHNIQRKIICEEFLPHKPGTLPSDYKFYCFNGKVDCILLCSDRENQYKMDYYSLDWQYLPYAKSEYRSHKKHKKPKNLKEMIRVAEKLSKDFPFVRIDLYNINGKIYFQEMTFTPAAGISTRNTDDAFNHFGSLIKLPKKQHKPINIKLRY